MRLLMVGINHRTAPVEVRERLALAGERLVATLALIRSRHPECECVILSTCNRTEVYVARPTHAAPTADDLRSLLAGAGGVTASVIEAAAIQREQEPAVQHLFRVCCGLDSMVLGEPQVLGQVKRAYEAANACGAVGPTLHRVFQQAVASAKRLRTATGIDTGRVSVASVAVDFARQVFEDFADKTIVGVGAGDMAKAMLVHLARLNPGRLWVVNRSPERSAALAASLQLTGGSGGARPWEELDELLVEADVVLTSTGATEPVITASRFRPLLRRRRNRPLFFVDIGMPRDVEPAVGGLTNVYLYNLDDLQRVVSQSLGQRRDEVQRCESALHEAAAACYRQVQHHDVSQLIRELRHRLHDIGRAEQQRTARKLAAMGLAGDDAEALRRAIDEHTHRVVNKILHLPLSQLDHKDPDAPLAFYAAALRRLFQIDDDAPPPADQPEDAQAQRVEA
jgi:glutamyl-tRNA reductase